MIEHYALIKMIHMATALLSICGLFARGILAFRASPLLQSKPVKILPHINDTLLLGCGISLAVIAGLNPLQHGWLLAKLVLLIAYIACGMLLLKWARSNSQRIIGLAGALACFAAMGFLAGAKPF